MKSASSHTPSAAEPAKNHAPTRDSHPPANAGACWSMLAMRSAEGPAGAPGSLAQKLVAGASEDPGAPLPDDAREQLEGHLGADLSAVRVHTDPTSAAAAAELGAGAYTIGRDVHFGAGRFDPAGERGRQLLAHEVAHTVDAPTAPAGALSVSEPSDPAETRARDSADAFIAGRPTAHNNTTTGAATIFRALSDTDKKTWDGARGDAHVEALRAAVGQWQTFRANPTSYLDMLGVTSGAAARELSALVAASGAQFGQHAADLLGGEHIKYLNEMAGFLMEFRLLLGVIPGVTWQDPRHTYKMNQSEFWGNSVPMLPISGFSVEYTNAYGWYWKQTMLGGGLALGVTKNGPELGPMSVSLNVEATARSVVYFGHQNLDGVLGVADGPSVKGTRMGFGAKVQSGGMIKMNGSGGVPGTLDFENLAMEVKVSPTGPDLPKDIENKNEISITLISMGLGYAWHDDETLVSTPTLVFRPIPIEQAWSYVIEGFATGDDAAPEERVAAIAERIVHDSGPARQKFEQVKERLVEYGIDQEFKLDIACDGFATRLWQGAGNNERARLDSNERLALRRAQSVATALESRLGAPHVYSARSRGAAVPTPDLGGVTPERGNKADIDRWVAEEIATQKQQFPDKPEDEIRRDVEAIYGRTSNVQPVRRVEVTVVWRGYDLGWDYGESPEPRDPNPKPRLPDGGGGAEGAGPEGRPPDNGGVGGAPGR